MNNQTLTLTIYLKEEKSPHTRATLYWHFVKQPSIYIDTLSPEEEVTPHQDGTFLNNNPLSLVGFWFPIDDATLENGCLW